MWLFFIPIIYIVTNSGLALSIKNESQCLNCSIYLLTLAEPPDIRASTSDFLAIEVSPGVVIASAPWAAP